MRIFLIVCVVLACMAMASADVRAEIWAHEGYTKIADWTLGGDIRVRPEWSVNMGNMGFGKAGAWNNIQIVRERARFWVKSDMDKKVTTYLRMTQEIRWGEDSKPYTTDPDLGNESRWAMLLDNAWLQVVEPFDLPVSFRVGRQDLLYGEGFLIVDSDSVYNGDGSRTYFFDAAKGTALLKAINTNVDFLFARSHEGDFNKMGDKEDLFGIYSTSQLGKPLKGEVYMLVRNQRKNRTENVANGAKPFGIVHPAREVYTWGSRVSGKWGNFNMAAEFAAQTGHINKIQDFVISNSSGTNPYKPGQTGGVSIRAFGGYAHAGYSFTEVPLKPSFMAGYWFMSGDDPNSSHWGGFDDLFSQAPIHGEYYLYSHMDLLSSADSDWDPFLWSNLHFPKFEFSIVPYENLKFLVTYMHMFAHKNDLTFVDTQGGHNRADYIQATVSYTFSENLAAHVRYEWYIPGSYYSQRAQMGQYGRFEITAKF